MANLGAVKQSMRMFFYEGSLLPIEWTNQHGCGSNSKVNCEVILQYMCEDDNPELRDGTLRGNANTAGGLSEPPTAGEAAEQTLGQHEPLEFYTNCQARERNKGLYTADQNVNDNRGATATRQNANGNANANNRNGLECPEERDYYPYWHPSPWHDIAIFTDEPETMCDYYRRESQNVKARGLCSLPEFNNPQACSEGGGSWEERWSGPSELEDHPPECFAGPQSRDNHLGNVRNGRPYYYSWKIPDYVEGRCVLRIRYNITTGDFGTGSVARPDQDGLTEAVSSFFMDSTYNTAPILTGDPTDDWLNLGSDMELQLQVNTAQYGRTFQDRSHSFIVTKRPSDVPDSARIVNYNVRGRRGNIVQVYPSVEYDFVPQDLHVELGDYLHFQWTGSDANANNAGNGRQRTDRSNLVQVASASETVPLPIDEHTLLFNAADGIMSTDRQLVESFAYLRQDLTNCDPEANNDNDLSNCHQLNAASAYFNGGLVEMRTVGEHHIVSTRNSDFSNRSQKAVITVSMRLWMWYAILALLTGVLALLAMISYVAIAVYALKHPASWLFSDRYRPRILRWMVKKETLDARLEERKKIKDEKQRKWDDMLASMDNDVEAAAGGRASAGSAQSMMNMARPTEFSGQSWSSRCIRMCARCGLHEQRLTTTMFLLVNVCVFLIGSLSNLTGGFGGSAAYPLAKGAGYTMDLNFAVLVLPTLKSVQTAMRRASNSRDWMPIDDPIAFHITVAVFIGLGSVVHVVCHCVHIWTIASAPWIYYDPLEQWGLTSEERMSGMTYLEQIFDLRVRCAAITGFALMLLMGAIYTTAHPCVRRSRNRFSRRLGGYNLFWKMHMYWPWVFVLLLLHAPTRLWIWFFFPAIIVAVDRMMLEKHQKLPASLKQVKLLPQNVIGLTFDQPKGFSYQAGQYILLGWQGEWHPFTLTSAPEENKLSVHIRAPDALDWCSALRRRLTVEVPEAASQEKMRPGDTVEYKSCVHPGSQAVYSQPNFKLDASPPRADDDKVIDIDSQSSAGDSPASCEKGDALPSDAVALQITGPFGAPAQKVWSFDTIMVVGAGIGVTPFASILRSVQLRTQQRDAILRAAGVAHAPPAVQRSPRGSDTFSSMLRSVFSPDSDKRSEDGTAEALEQLIPVPKKIYFYWIVRSQDEFDWFYEVLKEIVEGPARSFTEITVFLTGEIELSKVKDLEFASGGQFFGRPNWSRIFKENKARAKGQHVGVFLCGSPAIGSQLSEQSSKHSDAPGTPGGTRFSLFKENF
jgi:hypothetical protein